MTYRFRSYVFGISDPRKFPAERLQQLIALKLNPSDQPLSGRLDTLLPVLVSKRKIEEMNKVREHINALAGAETISSDQIKSLVFLRGLEVLTAECKESMSAVAAELQKFMGELPR